MLHVTSTGVASAVLVPITGPQALQQLVGGPIVAVSICRELAFYADRTAQGEPNPFVFDIVSVFGEPVSMMFGDVVFFAGSDADGAERSMTDTLIAALIDLIDGMAGRPESISDLIALGHDLRHLELSQ